MAAVNILLNGETREVPDEIKLEQLLDLFSLPKQRVAIELNGAVVRRADWHETLVNKGDKIEVVHFVGGG
ncbi:MAG: sulfur carrier protein ThiS [Chloracidobacterium sp.]|nr:sulfur carrier protein ThiS [Chloracidobacterium sp.]